MTPQIFHVGLSEGPSLLHPGRSDAWWALPDGSIAWSDASRLWTERGDRVTVVRARAPLSMPDLTVSARGSGWSCADRDGEVAIPDGAMRCNPVAWPVGRGLVWRDDTLLFRWNGTTIRAIGTSRTGDQLEVGPHGAVLIGDTDRWRRGAAAAGDVQPLAAALPVTRWGLRWSDDGARVAAPGVIVDLRRGAARELAEGLMPVDADGGTLDEHGNYVARGLRRVGVREASCAFDGRYLAGPGGVAWDLRTGRRCFADPLVPLGAVIATPGDWLAFDWQTGAGFRFDVRTGEVNGRMQLDVEGEDAITDGRWDGEAALVWTSEGRCFRVTDEIAEIDAEPEDREPDRAGEGWAIDRRGLHVDGIGAFDVPVAAGARVGGCVYAWSDDGLLVAIGGNAAQTG